MTTPETKWTPGPLVYAYGSIYHGTLDELNDESCLRIALMDRDEPRTMPTERDANAARLVACWNACLDMPDPAAEIAAMREALRAAYRELNTICARDGVPYCYDGIKSDVDPAYFQSVVDKCRAALSGGAQ